jgi:hypothetical protein
MSDFPENVLQFDYTEAGNQDSLRNRGGAMQNYRLMHWLADILKNFFSDPINIKDERICKLMNLQDSDDEHLDSLFDVGTPFSQDTKKACSTPMIIVSLGQTQYPVKDFGIRPSPVMAENGAVHMSQSLKVKVVGCTVSVATESYDGTMLLGGLIEDFLLINEKLFVQDNNTLSEFRVQGSTEPQEIKVGTAANAKTIYQMKIAIQMAGSISWTTDTQGPLFRGIKFKVGMKL